MQISGEITFQVKNKASAKFQDSMCLRGVEGAIEAGQERVRSIRIYIREVT